MKFEKPIVVSDAGARRRTPGAASTRSGSRSLAARSQAYSGRFGSLNPRLWKCQREQRSDVNRAAIGYLRSAGESLNTERNSPPGLPRPESSGGKVGATDFHRRARLPARSPLIETISSGLPYPRSWAAFETTYDLSSPSLQLLNTGGCWHTQYKTYSSTQNREVRHR